MPRISGMADSARPRWARLPAVVLSLLLVLTASAAPALVVATEDEDSAVWTMFEVWERDPQQRERLDALREIASQPGQPATEQPDRPIQIAFVYPSFDLSEGWARGAIAFRERLAEFNIPHQITEFGSTIDDHAQQASHIQTILAGEYDYVLIGPTELEVQQTLLQDLIQKEGTEVIIWNYNTPLREWDELGQPLSWVGFDHAEGGQKLCDWIVNETGGQGDFAIMHFTPGFLDDQRVGTFNDCATAAGMTNVYDHFADGTREMAYSGTIAALGAHPDLTHIHAANTATAMGTLSALSELGRAGEILLNGWGGGQEELDAIMSGDMHVTVMRMQDDFGVFPAEMLRMHLEGRLDEIPLVASGEIVTVDHRMTEDDIASWVEYAFRYSGELER
jgi:autoinducer 2-binding periplasmic protein LuxP